MGNAVDPLNVPGVAVDSERLLALRHLVRNIPERRLAPTGLPGGFVSRRRGKGLEPIDIRPFSFGDDVRHIDHNTTARTGHAHVRTYHDEREKAALLIADFRPSMLWGTRRALRSVAAAEALALVGWRVIEAGGKVGLIAIGPGEPLFVPARPRERGMAAVIGGLARAHRAALLALLESAQVASQGRPLRPRADPAESRADPPLDATLEMAARLAPSGGAVYLATGLDNPGRDFDALAQALRRRADLMALIVTDAFETRAPAGAYPFVTALGKIRWASRSGRAEGDLPDPRLAHLEALGIEVLPIDAGEDPEAMTERLDKVNGKLR